ncbi:MAG: Poly-beta-1,6-N-acetyl-D-glucosamine synthase [Candidatus Accumulibacter appositus]|uniref:Poly-beta-1,6-N-acetyl-D-glucosamine synthase n=1 Tax=Candidatus Accumulibacter appositus TaxID=1454003 RepID=A0A011PXQ4_9PROT|nr:MAG: Poly-beta-1,6-N-acetyl-D-glucosamine synthase [Candidatus Accumulibacter appositus]
MSQSLSGDPQPRPGSGPKIAAAVFFDPANKRWPRLRLGMALIAVTLSLLLGGLLLSILAAPVLPALHLPNVSFLPHGAHAVPDLPALAPERPASRRERGLRNEQLKLAHERERSLRQLLQPARANAANVDQQPLAIGFFVNWDDASMSSLKENLGSLDTVIAEWLHLASEDGTLRENDPLRTAHVTDYIRARRPDLTLVPLVNNWNGHEWEGAKLGRMLAEPAARKRTIEQILAFVESHRYAGISIDFENMAARAQPDFQRFMAELYAVMHPRKLLVSVNVPAADAAFDYRRLVRNADYLILMAYDEHWADGTPGPIASLPWFARVLRARQRDIPAEKMIVAIGNYAYDWGPPGHPAEERTFEEAVLTAKESEARLQLDPASLNPTFAYADDDGRLHHVWLLDAVSAFNQLLALRSLQPRGVALWRLGSEDPALWKIFGRKGALDAARAEELGEIRFAYGVDYEGKGEVLDVTAQPQIGRRIIKFDTQRGLISGERFTAYPSPYVITRHGGAERKIVLTFDDGPDPRFTPLVLDALRDAGVPATFFIIGANGQNHPDLLRRAVNEGHELGNHTFTHPNISSISLKQLELELSATQHLLASEVGRHSLLFRSPYAVDAEPETIDQVRPVEFAAQQGYVNVGMQIDPDDWKRPGTDEIVKRVVDAAERGEGNIVLLHDSGGDRTQTVAAIPRIAEALRKQGFEFVTVAQLLGRSRDAIMPPVPPEEQLRSRLDGAAFAVINWAGTAIDWLFVLGIVLGIARLLFVGGLAIYQRYSERHRVFDPAYAPSVAVVVPAFNEEKVIVQTIASLLACDSPGAFEIIVVDDGSSDATYRVASEAFANDSRVRVFSQANAGKPAALNFGFAQAGAEIVVALDADTVFTRETISKLVRHFRDPQVGAVAGNTKVGNRVNLLTRWQALEYITSQNLDRRAFAVLNCITVVPGAVGAWRRELVESAGGFRHDTLAEDADLTLAIRKLGKRIVYEEEAIALTEAPDTVRGFIGQRYRWMYGTMQAAWKHRDVLFRPRFGALGFVALPNVVIFQVLFPLLSPIMDLLLIGSLGSAAFNYSHHPEEYSADNLWRVLFYYALFVSVDYLAAILAFALERKESWGLLVWLFWQRFFYRQLMYYVAIKSTVTSLKGVLVGWGKLERKATVQAQA